MLGLGIWLGSNVAALGGGGAWTPASAAIPLSVWFDPTDISTLFKDTAGTVPVTADGDLVACMKDKSGNNRHATQATSINRPTYNTNSGKPCLTFGGSQLLITASGQIVNATDGTHSSVAAVIFTNNTGVQYVFDSSQAAPSISRFLINDVGAAECWNYNTSGVNVMNDGGPSITAGAATTLIETTATSTCEVWTNNTSNGSSAIFGTPPINNAANTLGVGATNSGGGDMTGKFFGGAIWSGVLSSSDRTSAHTLFFGKM